MICIPSERSHYQRRSRGSSTAALVYRSEHRCYILNKNTQLDRTCHIYAQQSRAVATDHEYNREGMKFNTPSMCTTLANVLFTRLSVGKIPRRKSKSRRAAYPSEASHMKVVSSLTADCANNGTKGIAYQHFVVFVCESISV